MNDGSMSTMDHLRAWLASFLASLAAGARRLEQWSARGTRPVLLSLLAIGLLAFGALAIVSGGHFFGGWWHRGPHPERAFAAPVPKPDGRSWGRPEGKPEGPRQGRPEGGFWGQPEGKPEAPRPPGPPARPAPPPPPGALQP